MQYYMKLGKYYEFLNMSRSVHTAKKKNMFLDGKFLAFWCI